MTGKSNVQDTMACDPRVHTLWVGILGGIISVAIDVDHLLVLWWEGTPVTLTSLVTQAGRPFHIPALIISGALCVAAFAYCYRLLSVQR